MTRVLCVGNATLDIINRVAVYPDEDTEVRASGHVERMGGNAANTACVLAQLGVETAWAGTLPASSPVIDRAFAQSGVDASHACRIADAVLPTSYIVLSEATGSRSIVHYRDLAEYPAGAFAAIDLQPFAWVHFEGRNVDQLAHMLSHARASAGLKVSLEVEKTRPGIEALFEHADLLLFSHDYARAQGFATATELLASLQHTGIATCTWGAAGAWVRRADGDVQRVAAPRLETVIDTVGAGDVFNAAMIHALGDGSELHAAVSTAVGLASAQCTRTGLELRQS